MLNIEFLNCNIIAWNIKGAINAKGKRHVKELVRKFKPKVFIVLETHTQFNNVKSFWDKLGYLAIRITEATSHSGGIWILVFANIFQVMVVDIFHQCVSIKLTFANQTWVYSTIYASPVSSSRKDLSNYLKSVEAFIQGPWMLIGDFNAVLFSSEVRCGSFISTRADGLAEMMES